MKDNTVVRSFLVTFFKSKGAPTKTSQELMLWDLRNLILTTVAKKKSKLRWLKLARFGDTPSAKNCLRCDANLLALSGVIGEHDDGVMSFDEAVSRLRKAMVTALVYTSPSCTEAKPRWRVVAPTSRDLPKGEHTKLMSRINGVLGGALTGESFVLSQSYFFGGVEGNPPPRCEYTTGEYIDLRDDLDVGAIGKPKRKQEAEPGNSKREGDDVRGFEAHLALMGDGPGLNGFNAVLCSASSSYAAAHGVDLDRNALKAKLRKSIETAPKAASRDAGDITRYLSDSYLDNLIKTAVEKYGRGTDDDVEIKRLAQLPIVEYERQRKTAAEKLGVRSAILDKLVSAERPHNDDDMQGQAISFPDPESGLKRSMAPRFWIRWRRRSVPTSCWLIIHVTQQHYGFYTHT